MQRGLFLLIITACIPIIAQAQWHRYLISFTDKNNSPYSLQTPSAFLSDSALSRRSRYGILLDSSDLPVNPSYIHAVRSIGNVRILNASKWFNRISIETSNPADIALIQSLPFVVQTQSIGRKINVPAITPGRLLSDDLSFEVNHRMGREPSLYGETAQQIQMHRIDFLHRIGFKGENIRMAVIDAGFSSYLNLPTFDSIRLNNQIKETWDFVDQQSEVNDHSFHGMKCLSVMGANIPGTFIGSAPKADFYLYRSEDESSEYPIEEHNLTCAIERADSAGVDICSISLGYSTFDDPSFDYSYADMNGVTTISSQSVQKGFSKGMLFVVSAGNEGNSSWRYINTPADADSALTVGAVDIHGLAAPFSSYGPSSDNQTKPDLVSNGWDAVVADPSNGQPTYDNGTSFACPNIAGLVSCIQQAFREKKQSEIILALQQSGHLSQNPDHQMGYGIPNAIHAFCRLQKTTFQHNESFSSCKVHFKFNIRANQTMTLFIDRKFQHHAGFESIGYFYPSDGWKNYTFIWEDDLSNEQYASVSYRYGIILGTDTTYLLDSVQLNYQNNCLPIPILINEFRIDPNPLKNLLTVNTSLLSTTKTNWSILNEKGQCLFKKTIIIPSGKHTESIDIGSWPNGYYLLSISDINGIMETKKFLKL